MSWEDWLGEHVERGWTDDEIEQDIDRRVGAWEQAWAKASGGVMPMTAAVALPAGPPTTNRAGDKLDWRVLHDRRRIMALLAEVRGEPTQVADAWWTPWRTEKAVKYREAVRWLRRNGGASVAAAARRADVDRGTLSGWIKAGKLEPPEAVPNR